jgi:O-antigen ligase
MDSPKETWIYGLTAASAAAVLVSIAAAQILLTAACLAWILYRPKHLVWPAYIVPLFAFMATTAVSLMISPDPGAGFGAVRKFVLFSMGLLAANFVTTAWRARTSHRLLLGVAAVTSVVAIVQFALAYRRFLATRALVDDPTVLARVTGFMGHWMTFSGEQLLVWCAALPALIVLGRRWVLPTSMIGAAMILSFTRSVWLGAIVGLAVVIFLMPRKIVTGVLLPMILVATLASGLIYHRLAMSLEEGFAPDTSRLDMLWTGLGMIRDNPLFGVGPERIAVEFPRYYAGTNDLSNFYYGHLHNNVLQIGAERGLLCLAAFLWLIFVIYAQLVRMLRTSDDATRWAALSAISAFTGFLVAGLFEYNFGDSEVLLLLLFILSVPYGLAGRKSQPLAR